MIRARSCSSGFTLLEALVAFAIAALALSALYDGALTGIAGARDAARGMQALALARSRLEAAGAMTLRPQVMTASGEEQGMSWRLRIAPAETARLPGTEATLYEIGVVVSWGDGRGRRQVRLDGTRIGLAQAPP
jgi:general secretion pathway protein I